MTQVSDTAEAIRRIFVISRPHPTNYMERGDDWQEIYYADLQVWITTVAATWLTMAPTGHDVSCRCCINFRTLCCNHEDQFRNIMGDRYITTRVSNVEIIQWAQMLDISGPQTAFRSITNAVRAWITNTQDPLIVPMRQHSPTLSDVENAKDSSSSSSDGAKPKKQTEDEKRVRAHLTGSDTSEKGRKPKQRKYTHHEAEGIRDVPRQIHTRTGSTVMESSSQETTSEHESRLPTPSRYTLRPRAPRTRHRKVLASNIETVTDVGTGTRDEIAIGDTSTGKAIKIDVSTLSGMGLPLLTRYLRNVMLCLQSTVRTYDVYRRQNQDRRQQVINKSELEWDRDQALFNSKRPSSSGWIIDEGPRPSTSTEPRSEPLEVASTATELVQRRSSSDDDT